MMLFELSHYIFLKHNLPIFYDLAIPHPVGQNSWSFIGLGKIKKTKNQQAPSLVGTSPTVGTFSVGMSAPPSSYVNSCNIHYFNFWIVIIVIDYVPGLLSEYKSLYFLHVADKYRTTSRTSVDICC